MQAGKMKIIGQISKEMEAVAKTDAVLKGSLTKVSLGRRKAGGKDKEAFLLTYKGEGKTKTVYVAKPRVAEVKRMIANYRRMKASLERLVELNVRLFKLKR